MRWVTPVLLFTTFLCYGQPLVHEEPYHTPIFQNKHFRVLNVKASSGDTTLFHIHENDIAYITLSGSTVWLQELDKDGRTVDLPTDWIGSNVTHSKDPLIHRFANVGEANFHLLAIEILTDKFSGYHFQQIGKVLFENERFSIQLANEKMIVSSLPGVAIIISSRNELVGITPIKPDKSVEVGPIEDSMKTLIVQLK